MENNLTYIFLSVLAVSIISFAGIAFLAISDKFLKTILSSLISFSAGALLGDVFLHIVPELAEVGFGAKEGWYFLIGIIAFFALERFVFLHHSHSDHDEKIHSSVYLTLIGDSLHNFIDGMVIAISFLVDFKLGVATTMAVIFHEIPQEIGQFAILVHGGWSRTKALAYNFISALTAVLGAGIVLIFAKDATEIPSSLLALAASSFVYIAMADIIPELQKEKSWSRSLSHFVWLLGGIAIMAIILVLE